tara:strand:- start:3026 stop:3235 length:210 start_codon:yes stop_codon:yes gene_type:complete
MAIIKKYILCDDCSGEGTRNKDQALPSNVVEIRKDIMLCQMCNGTGHSGYELLDIAVQDDITDPCQTKI